MGRAIVRNPEVFLFDEPLSNLDAKLRTVMRKEVKLLHQRLKTTSIYVTHDQTEAMTMADRIVVMNAGQIEQVGTPLQLYNRPGNLFVAGFIGAPQMNMLPGRVSTTRGTTILTHAETALGLPDDLELKDGQSVVLGIRPEHLAINPDGALQTVVEVVEPMGIETHLTCMIGETELRIIAAPDIDTQPGQEVRLSYDVSEAHVFDQATGDRIPASVEPWVRATLSVLRTPLIDFPAGRFVMGSDQHYPEEVPKRQEDVTAFRMDAHAVTNKCFAEFVEVTSYVTSCERPLDRSEHPDMPDFFCQPGSFVFRMTPHPVRLTDPRQWWALVPGASWRHPEGPGSSLAGREDHPVVHVSYEDALAFARWVGKSIPTEEQWEYAATLTVSVMPDDSTHLNIWRGEFPYLNERVKAHPFTVPAASNWRSCDGLSHMLGNVWEWTRSPYEATPKKGSDCCTATDSRAASVQTVRALKGGSYLCADSYCRRYRPSARIGMPQNESAGHIGFRCVVNLPQAE